MYRCLFFWFFKGLGNVVTEQRLKVALDERVLLLAVVVLSMRLRRVKQNAPLRESYTER